MKRSRTGGELSPTVDKLGEEEGVGAGILQCGRGESNDLREK